MGVTRDRFGFGAPGPGYGTPGGYGIPGGYGTPGGYGIPGYDAAGGYGMGPGVQPGMGPLLLTTAAKRLITTFIVLGAICLLGQNVYNNYTMNNNEPTRTP